jgi:hypothetical protein
VPTATQIDKYLFVPFFIYLLSDCAQKLQPAGEEAAASSTQRRVRKGGVDFSLFASVLLSIIRLESRVLSK